MKLLLVVKKRYAPKAHEVEKKKEAKIMSTNFISKTDIQREYLRENKLCAIFI